MVDQCGSLDDTFNQKGPFLSGLGFNARLSPDSQVRELQQFRCMKAIFLGMAGMTGCVPVLKPQPQRNQIQARCVSFI